MRFLISDLSAFALFSALSAELVVEVLAVLEFREAEADEDEEVEDSDED